MEARKRIFLSIVISTYNRKSLVVQSIQSAIEFSCQLRKPTEIIIVDDGSTDGSVEEILRRFKNEIDQGLICLHSNRANLGVNSAKNIGAKMSNGDWIVFLDSDDLLIAETARSVVTALENQFIYPLFFFRSLVLETNTLVGPPMSRSVILSLKGFLNSGTPGECLPVIRKMAFDKYPYDSDLIGCEGLAYARIIREYGAAIVCPAVVRRYRLSNNDRLSTIFGIGSRSCSLLKYHIRIVKNFWDVLTAVNLIGKLSRILVYGTVCSLVKIYRILSNTD